MLAWARVASPDAPCCCCIVGVGVAVPVAPLAVAVRLPARSIRVVGVRVGFAQRPMPLAVPRQWQRAPIPSLAKIPHALAAGGPFVLGAGEAIAHVLGSALLLLAAAPRASFVGVAARVVPFVARSVPIVSHFALPSARLAAGAVRFARPLVDNLPSRLPFADLFVPRFDAP